MTVNELIEALKHPRLEGTGNFSADRGDVKVWVQGRLHTVTGAKVVMRTWSQGDGFAVLEVE